MGFTYNPLLKAGLDQVGAGGGASVAGSDTQVQYNDSGSLGASADLTWDDTGKVLGVGGDIDLDGRFISSLNGAASAPPGTFTGTWFTGGTSTTTKPQVLIEPTGTSSTAWSTSGTGLGVNAASGFTGNLLDLQVNGGRALSISQVGNTTQLNILRPGVNSPNGYISSNNSDFIFGRNKEGTLLNIIQLDVATDTTAAIVTVGHASTNPIILASPAATSKTTFTIAGGDPLSNRAVDGHNLLLRGGNGSGASGTDRNGGDVYIRGGNNKGIGTNGSIHIGDSQTSGIGFFGATPVAQQTELTDELTTITHTAPGTPDYAIQNLTDTGGFGFASADEGNTVLSVIANLQTRVNELETKLVALGLLADAD